MKTFEIPTSNISLLGKSIMKINRRAQKLGAPMVELVRLSTEKRKVEGRGKQSFTTISITGDVPTIDGYEILAAVDHINGFNIVNNFPGKEFDSSEYRTRKPFCDHCNTHRLKKYSFIIRNTETGEMMQVGKTCLKDFFDKDVSAYVSWYSWFSDLEEQLADEESRFHSASSDYYFSLLDAVAVAFHSTRTWGYRKSDQERSTKDDIATYFFGKDTERQAVTPEAEDIINAGKAIVWVSDADSSKSQFIATVQDLVKMEDIPAKFFGYAAGIVPFFQNSQRTQISVLDEWVAEPKKRIGLTLTLKSKVAFESYYGMTYIHKFTDEKSHLIVWFASSDTDWNEGDTREVKATVKKHDEYQGVKQTMVNRITVQK